MGNDQAYIYGDYSLLKLIRDPDEVRLKLCPAYDRRTPDEPVTFNEVEAAVSIGLDRDGINMLIRDLRKMRDRVFGGDA